MNFLLTRGQHLPMGGVLLFQPQFLILLFYVTSMKISLSLFSVSSRDQFHILSQILEPSPAILLGLITLWENTDICSFLVASAGLNINRFLANVYSQLKICLCISLDAESDFWNDSSHSYFTCYVVMCNRDHFSS